MPPAGQWGLLQLPMLVLSSRWLGARVTYTAGGRRRAQPPQLLPALHWAQLHQAYTLQQPQPASGPAAHRRRAWFHQWRAEQSTTTTFSWSQGISLDFQFSLPIFQRMRHARWWAAASLAFGWERSPSPAPGPGTDQTRKLRESRSDVVDPATVGLFQVIHQEADGGAERVGVLQDWRDVPEQDPPLSLPRVSWARGAGSSFSLREN